MHDNIQRIGGQDLENIRLGDFLNVEGRANSAKNSLASVYRRKSVIFNLEPMTEDSKIRAVVTDDSQFMRQMIADILEDGGITVVAQAGDGKEAVDAVREHDPDVVTMDIQMPQMDGVEATELIMDVHPTPILILSAHASESAAVTFEALDNGAVDFFAKPGGEVSTEMQSHRGRLVEKVEAVARAQVTPGSSRDGVTEASSLDDGAAPSDTTIVIGSSTGGPTVVENLVTALPRGLSYRLLIVQHMPAGFTERFADRLDAKSEYDVWEAADGDRLGAGQAIVAPGDYHLEVANYAAGRIRVDLTEEPPLHGVRPSVDVTLRTAAEEIPDPVIGVILTGMGRDGAQGITALAETGGRAIAQDEATSAVFGMPKQAIATGHVDAVLPVEEMPGQIQEFARREATP